MEILGFGIFNLRLILGTLIFLIILTKGLKISLREKIFRVFSFVRVSLSFAVSSLLKTIKRQIPEIFASCSFLLLRTLPNFLTPSRDDSADDFLAISFNKFSFKKAS